jgi:hypothetical protein
MYVVEVWEAVPVSDRFSAASEEDYLVPNLDVTRIPVK